MNKRSRSLVITILAVFRVESFAVNTQEPLRRPIWAGGDGVVVPAMVIPTTGNRAGEIREKSGRKFVDQYAQFLRKTEIMISFRSWYFAEQKRKISSRFWFQRTITRSTVDYYSEKDQKFIRHSLLMAKNVFNARLDNIKNAGGFWSKFSANSLGEQRTELNDALRSIDRELRHLSKKFDEINHDSRASEQSLMIYHRLIQKTYGRKLSRYHHLYHYYRRLVATDLGYCDEPSDPQEDIYRYKFTAKTKRRTTQMIRYPSPSATLDNWLKKAGAQ